ncbi:MAG: riboflavin synthase [Acidobacteriota bacterium]
MFTGIVEALGILTSIASLDQGMRLEVTAGGFFEGASIGESIAVNGVCLTVVESAGNRVAFDVSEETLERTSLQSAHEGMTVNLERPLTLSTLLGGHLVQGHVDGKGRLAEVVPVGEGFVVRIEYPPHLGRYIVEKGSITVDGISLTIASLSENWFEIAVIPHTWRATNLSSLQLGAGVNLEVDIIAKYVEKLMSR